MSSDIQNILRSSRTIAVVGLSDKPDRDSYQVALYLQSKGYQIIPVNPNVVEILGEKSYSDLKQIPQKIDIVNIFRKKEAVPEIVDEAIAVKAKVVWMQDGIIHQEAAAKARLQGLSVVMDKCIKKELYLFN